MKKYVLLALKQNLNTLKKAIIDYGKENEWTIEEYDQLIPKNWDGDGVITDYVNIQELKLLKKPEKIPIVSRFLPPENNIRTILGDTWKIAELAVDYFYNRGFRNFATFEIYEISPEDKHSPMPHPVTTFEEVLKKRKNILPHKIFLNSFLKKKEYGDFQKTLLELRRFLRNIPKPCAFFSPNIFHTNYLYRACEKENINVPEEIAILVNNDDPNITESTSPTTSAIHGEIRDIALKMAKLLDVMMNSENPTYTPDFIQPTGIIERQSTDILAVPHSLTASAVNFFLSNYMNQISVTDVINHVGIPASTLKLMFNKYFKKTPGRFLRELRLNKAKELLCDTNSGLNEIALKTGYGSNMALSLAFKREFKTSPGKYRKIHREKIQQFKLNAGHS